MCNKRLFHLSQDDKIQKLIPRVPYKLWQEHEDNYVERICFSDSINGCLRALFADDGAKYYIYIPQRQIKIYRPSEKEVVDQEITNEIWGVDEVPVTKIGTLMVSHGIVKEWVNKQELELPIIDFVWKYLTQ